MEFIIEINYINFPFLLLLCVHSSKHKVSSVLHYVTSICTPQNKSCRIKYKGLVWCSGAKFCCCGILKRKKILHSTLVEILPIFSDVFSFKLTFSFPEVNYTNTIGVIVEGIIQSLRYQVQVKGPYCSLLLLLLKYPPCLLFYLSICFLYSALKIEKQSK